MCTARRAASARSRRSELDAAAGRCASLRALSIEPERAAAAFAELARRAPDGIWAAPGRVNLIGEHTDHNDGFVLPIAIERVTVAAVARRDDGVVRCLSLQEGSAPAAHVAELEPGRSDGWAAYVHGVVWALREARIDVGGADIVVDSDVPEGSGLSSSAALECAVAMALVALAGAAVGVPSLRDVTPERLDELTGVQLRRARHVVAENARVA